jgi:hypothetical protein
MRGPKYPDELRTQASELIHAAARPEGHAS